MPHSDRDGLWLQLLHRLFWSPSHEGDPLFGGTRRQQPIRLLSACPLLHLLIPFILGIAFGDAAYAWLAAWRGTLLVATGTLLVATGTLLAFSRRHPARWQRFSLQSETVAIWTTSFFIGATMLLADRKNERIDWPKHEETFRVMVVDNPRFSAHSIQFTGRLLSGRNAGQNVRWRLAQPRSQTVNVTAGDVLLCRTHIEPPRNSGNPSAFDYVSWLRRQGVYGTAFVSASSWTVAQCATADYPLAVRALRLRSEMVERYADYFAGRDLAVLSALTLGDKARLDTATRERYAEGGVSHVLALSGLHLGILFSLYQLLALRFCRRRAWRIVGALTGIGGLWAFVLLAGMPLSLIRSAVMFSIMQVLTLFRHDSFSVNNLAIAALCLLVTSPQSLFDVGLQLSCVSVFAILMFVPRLPVPRLVGRVPICRWLYGLLCVSFVAQAATAPLVAYYFHTFSVYGLVANLLVVPLAYPLLASAVLFFLLPFMQTPLAAVMGLLLRAMDGALSLVTAWPHAVLRLYPSELTTLLSFVFLSLAVGALWPSRLRLRRPLTYAAIAVLLATIGYEIYRRRPAAVPPQVMVADTYGKPILHLISSSRHSYLWLPYVGKAADSIATTSFCHDLWVSRCMTAPLVFSDSLRRSDVFSRHGVTSFGGCRIAVLSNAKRLSVPPQPLAVDYLLLANDCRMPLERVFRLFRPRCLLLASSLPDYYVRQCFSATRQRGIDVRDMHKTGALYLPLHP